MVKVVVFGLSSGSEGKRRWKVIRHFEKKELVKKRGRREGEKERKTTKRNEQNGMRIYEKYQK